MDRVAELAAEMMDEAMLRTRASLGDSPIAYLAEQAAIRAARSLCEAALEAAAGRYRDAANRSGELTS